MQNHGMRTFSATASSGARPQGMAKSIALMVARLWLRSRTPFPSHYKNSPLSFTDDT